jgi:hypothetical protein
MIIKGCKVLEARSFVGGKDKKTFTTAVLQTEGGLLKVMFSGNGIQAGQVGNFLWDGLGINSLFGELQVTK